MPVGTVLFGTFVSVGVTFVTSLASLRDHGMLRIPSLGGLTEKKAIKGMRIQRFIAFRFCMNKEK